MDLKSENITKTSIKRKDTTIQFLFFYLKCTRGINLCSHVAQWEVVNKKLNVSAISYFIYIYIYI